MRAAQVRFYFDADILRLAHTVVRYRSDCTFPGDPGGTVNRRTRPPCPIPPGAKDTVWLPQVAHQGWLIVTRDHHIAENPAEVRAVRESGARMVALSGDSARTSWDQLELFMTRWRRIEQLVDEPGPFIYVASRTRFRMLDLT